MYEQKVQEEAKKHHIDLYGKDIYQILREINEQKVLQMADELNMDKMNMNIQELAEKIKKDQPEKGKELNFVPMVRTDADAFYSYLTN